MNFKAYLRQIQSVLVNIIIPQAHKTFRDLLKNSKHHEVVKFYKLVNKLEYEK